MDRNTFDRLFYQENIAQQPFELWMLLGIIEKMIPWVDTIIEIGVYLGGTLRVWREIVGPNGLVIAIDDGKRGFMEKLQEQYRDDDAVTLVVGDSMEPAVIDVMRNKLEHSKAGMLFIDGCHDYAHVKSDYNRYRGHVRPGGLIVFHGIKNGEIRRVWDEIIEGGQFAGVYELYDRHNCTGTGVIVTD